MRLMPQIIEYVDEIAFYNLPSTVTWPLSEARWPLVRAAIDDAMGDPLTEEGL
jgi:hypothetical protein